MSHLTKLKLSASSPRQSMSPLARKRLKLLQNLDKQMYAADAASENLTYCEKIQRWVKNKETGAKELVEFDRPIKHWWWENDVGSLMLTLRDGNKIIPITKDKTSIEVGNIDNLVETLETVKSAVTAQELDAALETLISERKIPKPRKAKAA